MNSRSRCSYEHCGNRQSPRACKALAKAGSEWCDVHHPDALRKHEEEYLSRVEMRRLKLNSDIAMSTMILEDQRRRIDANVSEAIRLRRDLEAVTAASVAVRKRAVELHALAAEILTAKDGSNEDALRAQALIDLAKELRLSAPWVDKVKSEADFLDDLPANPNPYDDRA